MAGNNHQALSKAPAVNNLRGLSQHQQQQLGHCQSHQSRMTTESDIMTSPMSPPPLRTTPFFQAHSPPPTAPEPPYHGDQIEVIETDYSDTEDEGEFTGGQVHYPMPPTPSPYPESEASTSHDSEMDDIMAIQTNSDGYSVAPSTRDSMDRLSEYRRHGAALPEMEAAAVNAFNAANGTNFGPEIGFARPPNASPPGMRTSSPPTQAQSSAPSRPRAMFDPAVLAVLGAHPEVVGGGNGKGKGKRKGKGKGKEKPKPKPKETEGKKRGFWGGGSGFGCKRRKGEGKGE